MGKGWLKSPIALFCGTPSTKRTTACLKTLLGTIFSQPHTYVIIIYRYLKMSVSYMKKMIFSVTTEFDLSLPYYFSGVGCSYEQENINRPEGYPEYQWIQCRSGKGELNMNGTKYIIEEGQGMFFFPDEPHEYHALDEKWEVDWIIFRGTHISTFVRDILRMTTSGVYYVTTPHIISDKLEELYSTASSANSMKNLVCSSIVYSVLLDILRLTSAKQNTAIVNKLSRINSVLRYIDENYTKQLSLAELSEIAELTPQYLCSAFKKSTTQTMFEYINMVRIRKSKEILLYDRGMQIKEIAGAVGFDDVSYFCSVFRRFEKMSPTEFRMLHS